MAHGHDRAHVLFLLREGGHSDVAGFRKATPEDARRVEYGTFYVPPLNVRTIESVRGEDIAIRRSEAENHETYKKAAALADERGVELRILDDADYEGLAPDLDQ